MNKLKSLKDKLNQLGYTVHLKEDDNIKYIKGGYSGDDVEKSLNIDIKVLLEDDRYVFIDWDKQISVKRIFDKENKVVDYIKQKYPL